MATRTVPSTTGRAVGALACQFNSYQTTLDTEIISCAPATKVEQPGVKGKKKEQNIQDTWLIECADSVLFPEGGGQPCDHGTLTILAGPDQTSLPIQNVQREGLRCLIHSPQSLPVGTKVRQKVDWTRRWDLMQQHTGQHLLSAMMKLHSGDLETVGWGMGSEGAMNYVDLQRKPSEEELEKVQTLCTRMIRENHNIWLETPDDAKHDSLPEDYDKAEGVVRVIHIGDADANTCCGTHLSQTSHIGLIIFGSTQSVHGKQCRLQFMAGDRAIHFATASVKATVDLAKQLSSKPSPSEILIKVGEMSELLTESRRMEKKLLLEIADFEVARAKIALQTGKNALVHRPAGGMEFINRVLGELKEAVRGTGLVAVIAIGEVRSTGPVYIIGDKEVVALMVEKVKSVVTTIKGGGAGERWQGKVSEWQKAELNDFKALF